MEKDIVEAALAPIRKVAEKGDDVTMAELKAALISYMFLMGMMTGYIFKVKSGEPIPEEVEQIYLGIKGL